MKKPTWVAAGVLLALGAVFFLLQEGEEERAPQELGFVIGSEGADEISVGGSVSLVLHKEGKAWRLKKPIDFPLDEKRIQDLQKLTRRNVEMDLQVRKDADPTRYQLGDEAISVVFSKGGKEVSTVRVGKEVVIKSTEARRTFVQETEGGQIYRAQGDLRSALVHSLRDWRSKDALVFDPEEVVSVLLSYEGKKIEILRGEKPEGSKVVSKGFWTSKSAPELDHVTVDGFVSALGRLKAEKFGDDLPAETTGLGSPVLEVAVRLKGGAEKVLLLGAADGQHRYAQIKGEPWVYKLTQSSSASAYKRLGELRPLQIIAVKPGSVKALHFVARGGSEPLTLQRKDDDWSLQAPALGKAVSRDIASALAKTLERLKAVRMVEDPGVNAQSAGIVGGQRLQFTLEDGRSSTLYFGNKVSEGANDVYARLGEDGEIFVLAMFKMQKLLPRQSSLLFDPVAH